jgi:putative intracellular protease/amidase
MKIQILLYERMTALDAIGPYECLSRLTDADVKMVGLDRGEIRTDTGFLGLTVDRAIDEVGPCDVLLVPGGDSRAMIANEAVHHWIRTQHQATRYTTSVCTGSLVLAAAGIIQEGEISSHWGAERSIQKMGLGYSGQRITRNGKVITAAGVSAGIDMGLMLCELLADRSTAEAIQLGIEYDPRPPFAYVDNEALRAAALKAIT